jgi:hypothetical protein
MYEFFRLGFGVQTTTHNNKFLVGEYKEKNRLENVENLVKKHAKSVLAS